MTALAGAALTTCARAQGWQTSQLVNLPSETACKTAKLVASRNGGFHAVYYNTKPWLLQYRRYKDGYLGPVRVLDNNFGANPDICEAGNGDVYAVWEDWQPDNYPGWARSSDGGQTFATGLLASWNGCKFPQVAAYGPSTGANVLVSFARSLQDTEKKLFYSTGDGSTWTTATDMGSYFDNEYALEGICRSLADGTLYRAYGRKSGSDFVLCYRRFNGTYWEPEVIVYQGGFFCRESIAVNPAGQVMVVWEQDNRLYSKVNTPGVGWSAVTTQEYLSTHSALTAIPGTNDFYLAYTYDMKRVYGVRYSGGGWLPKELVSVGLPDGFTAGVGDVSADPNGSGTIYACWEYWGSGDCQQFFSIRPGGSAPDSAIAGFVRDQDGQGVPGVTVGSGAYSTISGSGGGYSLSIPHGTYSVSANKQYYTGQTISNVSAVAGGTTALDFTITANPPASVTAFRVDPSDGVVRLSWVNPSSGNFAGTLIRAKTTGYPTGPTDGILVCDKVAPPGTPDSFTHSGLANGTTYYYAAFAHDDALHYSASVRGHGTPHSLLLSEVKQFSNGYAVDLIEKVVTGVFSSDGCIYIGEPDRASGIRVATSQGGLAIGDRVSVSGTMSTRIVSGCPSERQITAGLVTKTSSGAPLQPIAMGCRSVGGAAIGDGVPGVKDGSGANNMGALIKITGKVTKILSTYIFIDDGSRVENVSGLGAEVGVMVKCPSTPSVTVGSFVSATGIAEGSIPSGWTTNRRYLRLRASSDLVKLR